MPEEHPSRLFRSSLDVEACRDRLTVGSGGKGQIKTTWPIDGEVDVDMQIMERPEIVELFYSALLEPNDVEALSQFLSPRVEWILSAADPQTLGKESPPNAIKFSGKQGFQELALYMRESLHVISGDLTGCITHHQFVFAFGRVRLQSARAGQLVETNIAAKITFQASKIIIGQIRISWPLVF